MLVHVYFFRNYSTRQNSLQFMLLEKINPKIMSLQFFLLAQDIYTLHCLLRLSISFAACGHDQALQRAAAGAWEANLKFWLHFVWPINRSLMIYFDCV